MTDATIDRLRDRYNEIARQELLRAGGPISHPPHLPTVGAQ